MDWNEVKRRKQVLIEEVASKLSKEDLNLLQWLLDEERRNRFLPKAANKIPKALREQIDAITTEAAKP